MQTTYMAKPHEIERRWYIIDAAGRPLEGWPQKRPAVEGKT